MKRRGFAYLSSMAAILGFSAFLLSVGQISSPAEAESSAAAQAQADPADNFEVEALQQFRTGSLYTVNPNHRPGFVPSLDFPADAGNETRPWEAIDFRTDPELYLRRVLAYVLEGNVEVDWDVRRNAVRGWYHAPWMHAGRRGREPIRGLTLERRADPHDLHTDQSRRVNNWAVGFYNRPGGYTLGRVWADRARPDTRSVTFPVGTVSAKLLFTDATTTEVPYLANSLVWHAQIRRNNDAVEMRLLQVDLAIRDPRAGRTGWVFGTFLYNSALPGTTVWERLEPVGLHWGNDRDRSLADHQANRRLTEGWVNPAVAARFTSLPRRWLGLWGRMNGPVDNPSSACLACHGRAMDIGYRNVNVPFEPDLSSPSAIRHFFTNRAPTEPFFPNYRPLDYSLQLADGVANYRTWVADRHPAHREFIYGENRPGIMPRVGTFSLTEDAVARRRRSGRMEDYESPFVRGED